MQVSEAESVVMQALWRESPLAAEDVVAAVAAGQGWQEATVKTLLNRLLKKGAIRAEREGRRYLYAPVLSREDWLRQDVAATYDALQAHPSRAVGLDAVKARLAAAHRKASAKA